MDAIHPVRVVLFWDSEHARDAYDPYFTGSAKKSWTFNRMVTHDELVRKILKHRGMNQNLRRVQMTMRVPSFYAEYQMFNFTLYNMNNDEEIHYLWNIRPNIAMEGIRVLVEFEPIQSQTSYTLPERHDTNIANISGNVTIITYMVSDEPSMLYRNYTISSESEDDNDPDDKEEDITTPLNLSSQWFSGAPYDYIQFGAFLDMGSGEQIDDLVELGTIRLLDLDNAMTDIQLSMSC
ncbi:hypothetical protein M9H77_14140 [Catharanthus roseus]|uniref:Uncharacterized protein n=1 Tax=Catharanthus roseus TaxID=4058 RepID=A0ACC0BMC0_CATRO|nr:hypothetical protein M9H77_14140 [Catharanthus roseus]